MTLRDILQPGADWLEEPEFRRVAGVALVTAAGFAVYGFTVGDWRDPWMGVYVAVKFPLLIALTLGCNGLLNGLLGQLLGSGLGFRQSWLALLSSFALAALILGSLAPVTWWLAWHAPTPDAAEAAEAHAAYLLMHTCLIGFAGIAANLHLYRLLAASAPTLTAAKLTLLAWIGGNGLLGAQFSWVLRPFFGSPSLEVAFLRKDPLRGNFYEGVWSSLVRASGGYELPVLLALLGLLLIPLVLTLRSKSPAGP